MSMMKCIAVDMDLQETNENFKGLGPQSLRDAMDELNEERYQFWTIKVQIQFKIVDRIAFIIILLDIILEIND